VSESSTNPPAEGDDWANFDLRQFVLSTVKSAEWAGHELDVLRQQVLRIEECASAPWWRRWLLWARLRRDVRASVATFDDDHIARGDFLGRRSEWSFQQAWQISEMERGTLRRGDEQPGDADPGAGFLA
jgi:hypothetical protein